MTPEYIETGVVNETHLLYKSPGSTSEIS